MAQVAAAPGDARSDAPVVDGELGDALDAYLTRLAYYGFSGGVLVRSEGETVLRKGYGLANRDEDTPNTAVTRFDVGSISKQFTAAAVLRLQELEKLDVTASIASVFDGVVDVPDDKQPITIHHLLTHTSGLNHAQDFQGVNLGLRDAMLRHVLGSALAAVPGETFQYSNVGYFLLGAIIEIVSGEPFEDAVRALIFEPAGMDNTTYVGDDALDDQPVAHGYDYARGDVGPAHRTWFGWGHRGAAGVISTIDDLLRWHDVLATDDVLNEASRTAFTTPFKGRYAYGWYIDDADDWGRLVEHGGATGGFESIYCRWVEKDTVLVVLMNTFRRESWAVRGQLENLLRGAEYTLPPYPIPQPPVRLWELEGAWQLAPDDMLHVVVDNETLLISATGQNGQFMLGVDPRLFTSVNAHAISESEFVWLDGSFDLVRATFDRESQMLTIRSSGGREMGALLCADPLFMQSRIRNAKASRDNGAYGVAASLFERLIDTPFELPREGEPKRENVDAVLATARAELEATWQAWREAAKQAGRKTARALDYVEDGRKAERKGDAKAAAKAYAKAIDAMDDPADIEIANYITLRLHHVHAHPDGGAVLADERDDKPAKTALAAAREVAAKDGDRAAVDAYRAVAINWPYTSYAATARDALAALNE